MTPAPEPQPIFWSVSGGAPPARVNGLRRLSFVDGLLLAALIYAVTTENGTAVALLGAAYGSLYLVLLAALRSGAQKAWWTWAFFAAVLVLGPVASIPGLELYRRRR